MIAKLNDFSTDNEREQYSVLCNEKDFHAIKKVGSCIIFDAVFSFMFSQVAVEKKCSFSVVVKYLKNEEFNKEHAQKYIDDLLKPNSIHVSVTILGRSYSPKSTDTNKDVKNVQMLSTDVDQKVNEMRDSLSLIYKNLENLETCIGSINIKKIKKNICICRNCKMELISGEYYRCTTCSLCYDCRTGINSPYTICSTPTCSYFDLCTKCFEVKDVHDSSHPFLEIKKPTGNSNLSSALHTTKALDSE